MRCSGHARTGRGPPGRASEPPAPETTAARCFTHRAASRLTDGKSYFASAAGAGPAPSGGSERRYATIAFRSLGSIFAYRLYGMNGRSVRPLRLMPVVIAFLI